MHTHAGNRAEKSEGVREGARGWCSRVLLSNLSSWACGACVCVTREREDEEEEDVSNERKRSESEIQHFATKVLTAGGFLYAFLLPCFPPPFYFTGVCV